MGPADAPDRYELLERRAAGGEGEVWKAQERHGGETFSYAVKQIQLTEDAATDRHLEELRLHAALATHLEHAAVVKVKEVFVGAPPHQPGQPAPQGRRLYFVMKWIEGRSLQEALESGEIRGLQVLQPLQQIAEAIDYLHSGRDTNGNPVIHRDIKPANVLLTADGRVYLVDFGLVRLRATDMTSRIFGTAPFMAPESLARGEYTPASDRYALGATVYYAITGEAPVPGDIDGMTQRMTAALGPGRDREIHGILAMLSSAPDARPASAAAWVRALLTPPMETAVGAGGAAPTSPAAPQLPPTIGPAATGYPMPPGSFAPPGPSSPTPVGATSGPPYGGPTLGSAAAGGPMLSGPAAGGPPSYGPPQLSAAAGGFMGPGPQKKKSSATPWVIVGLVAVLVGVFCCLPVWGILEASNRDGYGSGYGTPTPTRSFDKSDPPPSATNLRKALVSVGDISAVMDADRSSIYTESDSGLLDGGLTELQLCDDAPVPGYAIGSSESNGYSVGTSEYPDVASAVAGFYSGEAKTYFKDLKEAAGRCGWSEMQTAKLGDQTLGIFSDNGSTGKVAMLFVRKGQVIIQVAVDKSSSYQSDAIRLATAMAKRIPKS